MPLTFSKTSNNKQKLMRIILANKLEKQIYVINTLTNTIDIIPLEYELVNCWCTSSKYLIVLEIRCISTTNMYKLDVYALDYYANGSTNLDNSSSTSAKVNTSKYPIIITQWINYSEPKMIYHLLSKDENILTIYIEKEVVEYKRGGQQIFMTKKCILYNRQTRESYIKNLDNFPKSVELYRVKKKNEEFNKCKPRCYYHPVKFLCKSRYYRFDSMRCCVLSSFKIMDKQFHRIATIEDGKYKIVDFLCDKMTGKKTSAMDNKMTDKTTSAMDNKIIDRDNKNNYIQMNGINHHTYFETKLNKDLKGNISIMLLTRDNLLVRNENKLFITDLMFNVQQSFPDLPISACNSEGSYWRYGKDDKIEGIYKLNYSRNEMLLINSVLEKLNGFMIFDLIIVVVRYLFMKFDADKIIANYS